MTRIKGTTMKNLTIAILTSAVVVISQGAAAKTTVNVNKATPVETQSLQTVANDYLTMQLNQAMTNVNNMSGLNSIKFNAHDTVLLATENVQEKLAANTVVEAE